MAKPRRDRVPHREPAAKTRRPPLAPERWVLGLALAGVLLTVYLSIVALNRDVPAFCTAGSACDLVQQSRWSKLFGVPVAVYGLGLYLLLALAALFASPKVKAWRRMWSLALVGLAVSVYFTVVAAIDLGAFCTWCLVSLALIAAIFARLSWRRPATAPGEPWRRLLLNHAIVLLALLGVMLVAQAGWLVRPADPRLAALATHLESRGAKFYGASWCPRCQEQKDLFGRAAEQLPYVECSPQGRGGPTAFACLSANVQAFPTWVIRGRAYPEVLTPEELARRSGFDWAGFREPAE